MFTAYRLKQKLGESGSSTLFSATHLWTGFDCVVQRWSLATLDSNQTQQLTDELARVAKLDHTNLPRTLGTGLSGGDAFLAVEYFPGGSLVPVIDGGIHPDVAFAILLQVTGALAAMHESGLEHGNVQASQILLRQDGTLGLANFGIARRVEAGSMAKVNLTARPASPQTDMRQSGQLLFEMLTQGKLRYCAQSPPLLPDEAREYQSLVNGMMSDDTKNRFRDMKAVHDAVLDLIVKNGKDS